jgi:tetratricopeptide (TPR) repeat protein
VVDWQAHAEREIGRYEDGESRLPDAVDADDRQRQLTRMGNAAGGAGLALLMSGKREEAGRWFASAAQRYRESFADAPPESFGRLLGAVKARLLAGDREGAVRDARWALEQVPADTRSPVGRYAAALSSLVLDDGARARELASALAREDPGAFPRAVADALLALAERDAGAYADSLERVLRSFEERDSYLEDVPVADTVLVLEALAEDRGIAIRPTSALLPE